jgi:hypothetical protein
MLDHLTHGGCYLALKTATELNRKPIEQCALTAHLAARV